MLPVCAEADAAPTSVEARIQIAMSNTIFRIVLLAGTIPSFPGLSCRPSVFVCVRFPVPGVRLSRCRLCHRHHKPPVLYAFQANEAACELLDLSRSSVHDEHLETRIVVEMRVAGRDHQLVMGMLDLRQLLCDSVSVMVVDKGDSTDYRGFGARGPLRDEAIANQVAKGFGPIGVSKPGDEIIEAIEEIGIERNPDSTENSHGRP